MNFLSSNDLTASEMRNVFRIADSFTAGKRFALKKGSSVALFFGEPSTRTRTSFSAAASQVGSTPIYIDARTSQASRGEELSDTARILSLYCDFIVVRINSHEGLLAMANSSKVPVINALTSLEHPTQALADVYTIMQKKGKIKGLKIGLIGDIAQNTFNSLMLTAAKLGAEISLVGPKGTKPNMFFVKESKKHSKVDITSSIKDGLNGCDVVYTDTFVSMGTEKSASARRKKFSKYILDKKALGYAKKGALVMHPLPAHRGEEISADVLEGKQSVIWDQAKNKQIIAESLLVYLSRKK